MEQEEDEQVSEAVNEVREGFDSLKEKARNAAAEIKENFKADEGTEGTEKAKSMFANLWKSGTVGKVAIVVGAIVAYKLIRWIL